MRPPRNTPITNTRRADLLGKIKQSFQTGAPVPPLVDIAEEWQTQTKAVCAYMRSLRRRGIVQTEKRGRRIYVVELRS